MACSPSRPSGRIPYPQHNEYNRQPAEHQPSVQTSCPITHMHIIKPAVNLVEFTVVRDKLVDPQGSVQVVCHVISTDSLPQYVTFVIEYSPSTIPGISVRPLTPPNADPFHVRPVTSWNLRRSVWVLWKCGKQPHGRVEISAPAGATPIMLHTPQPLWHTSRALRMTPTWVRKSRSSLISVDSRCP
jgi:hypothetical protein